MRNHINMKYLCFADDKRIPPGQCSMPLQDVLASGLDAAPVIPPLARSKNQPVVLYESRGVYL